MQLRRVQSANYSFNVTRTDLNQFGQLARIDSLILEAPTVSADVSYFLGDGFNEEVLNFANSDLNVGFVSGQITSSSGQNLYIMTSADGKDASVPGQSTGSFGAIGIGNAFVTDYSLEASVGSFPTVTVSFEGSNINASTSVSGTKDGFSGTFTGAGIDPVSGTPIANQIAGAGIEIRAADPGTDAGVATALRPSDIVLDLESAGGDSIADLTGAHVQSVSISVPLSRTPIERLGTRFPFARTVDFPITPTLSVSAVLSETQERSLTNIIANDAFIPNASITIKDSAGTNAAVYKLTNLKLDSESFSSSIGPNKTVDLTFSISVGGPDDLENNIFFSGANTDAKFALQPVKLNGGGLAAGESIKVNGVVFDYEASPKTTGEQIVGYVHGQTSRSFPVTYTGAADLDLSSVAGGAITGNDGANGITGLSGAAGGTLVFAPTDKTANTDITGGLSLS
jgi:voltage-gated potassium channel Kch